MDLETVKLSETSQTEKDKYHMLSHLKMVKLMYVLIQNRRRLTDIEDKFIVT